MGEAESADGQAPIRPPPSTSPGPAGGEHGASGFDDFYQAWYGRLCAQIHAYVGSRAEAEDVVQEAFVRAWLRWSQISRYDDPAAWVRRVAWNLATSVLRRFAVAGRVLRRHATAQHTPELSSDHVALVHALRRLPQRQRLAVVLHHIADLPVDQIAAELGVPSGTVQSWLHRGRAQLAAHLTDASESPPPADTTGRRRRRR